MPARRVRLAVASLLVAVSSVLVSTGLASAHSELALSSPKLSAVLTKAPTQVSLTFNDELIDMAGANQIVVTNPKGTRVDSGVSKLDRATLTTALKRLTVFGRYKVSYRILSADGHPVSAFYYFYFQKKK